MGFSGEKLLFSCIAWCTSCYVDYTRIIPGKLLIKMCVNFSPSILFSMIITINFSVFVHCKFNWWSFSHLKFMYSLISGCDCKNNDTNTIKQFNLKKNNWLCFTVNTRWQKDFQLQLSRQLFDCTSSFSRYAPCLLPPKLIYANYFWF